MSVIPDTLGIKPLGRAVNGAILLTFLILAVFASKRWMTKKIFLYYAAPIALMLSGYFLNILRSASLESLGALNILIPGMAALSVPFVKSFSREKAWDIFYWFMLIFTALALLEYFAILDGLLTPSSIETNFGVFYKGIVSILYSLDDGTRGSRFYGIFWEPGTAAMFLLPALTYALVFSKRIAAFIFIFGIYMTDSLGGYFCLLMVATSFLYWKLDGARCSVRRRVVAVLLMGSFGLALFHYTGVYFSERYEKKGNSAVVREDNVFQFASNFNRSLMANPFGFKLTGESLTTLNSNGNYLGSNFSPYVALVLGGVLGFVGYSLFVLSISAFSIKYFIARKNDDKIAACAFISLPALLTFIFQRATILESTLFAFLFAAPLIEMIGIPAPMRSSARRPP